LVAACVLTLSVAIIVAAGVFNVRHVQVIGAGRSTTLRIDALAKSFVGDSILTISTGTLRHRVAALPQIADVQISRDWPNTLRVRVVERQPLAAVQQPDGRWLLVDKTATAYVVVGHRPAPALPLTVDPAAGSALRAAIDVLVALPATVRRDVVGVAAPSAAGIRLTLRGGSTVIWGGPQDSARKARALAVLLHRHARVYDVSTPGFVTTS
jgi:cell division protein FtsQ